MTPFIIVLLFDAHVVEQIIITMESKQEANGDLAYYLKNTTPVFEYTICNVLIQYNCVQPHH